jgi:hypothetical protein
MPAWPPGMPLGGDPDWLTERLARDAALQERTEWNGLWKRRLAAWGAAGVLLALLMGGGLWLYEQSRVEGALVVVANTNPAPDARTLQPAGVPAPVAVPVPMHAPVSAPVPAGPPMANIDRPAALATPAAAPVQAADSGLDAVGGTAGPSTASGAAETQTPAFADRTVVPVATDAAAAPKPKRKHSRVSRHGDQEASAEVPQSERSYRQRYEETLMQCRAHGYDDRQCLQRGCEMTRYGFACKG